MLSRVGEDFPVFFSWAAAASGRGRLGLPLGGGVDRTPGPLAPGILVIEHRNKKQKSCSQCDESKKIVSGHFLNFRARPNPNCVAYYISMLGRRPCAVARRDPHRPPLRQPDNAQRQPKTARI